MATLVLGAAGAAMAGGLGSSVLGLGAAALGRAAGATVGRVLDQRILGGGAEAVDHGRVDRFRITGAAEGAAIPRVTGRMRVGGQVIWASRFKEHVTETGGGKGAPSTPRTRSFRYSASFALALCEGEIGRVGRVWADGEEVARDSIPMRVHLGTEDQLPDALIEAVEGGGQAPAFRGVAYVVVEDLDLTRFGNRVPQLSFEVVRPVRVEGAQRAVRDLVRGVALVPGTGEYSLATSAVHYDHGDGVKDWANVNTVQGVADFEVALRDLTEELPNVGAMSLVVSWFGDDLRCGSCSLRPLVEQNAADGVPIPWAVAGLGRGNAGTVPLLDGRPVYGGTPADAAVVEAIRAIAARGLEATFYPFVLMTQLAGNGLPDPWGGAEQAVLPWRGRITTEMAPGQAETSDRSAAARAEVEAFFGTARASDFTVGDGVVSYSGPDEWSYRRFILHYAALCAAAGGVEGFCIGSELRALTQVRGAGDDFPAVEALVDLLTEVRVLLPDAKLGYAADWSEYFGHHPSDTGNVHFHLDPLWAHPDCDFVGIDNYMPLSDWRDGSEHLDAGHQSVLDRGYLSSGVEGGEGFDWYYADEAGRAAQARLPITDGAHGEPWLFRYKDVRSWWGSAHHERIGGQRVASSTAWVPQSKPLRFVEYGCAAIDKGANQPNKFLDPKSSESQLPYFSNGQRDDAMQEAYLSALLGHWEADGVNPISSVYGGPMLDLAHSFAWAWDARPWPSFPELSSFWTDGPNHARGHWLGGRSGNQRLAEVIAEICAAAGLPDVDVSAVRGVLRGHLVQGVQTGRADLQSLLLVHGVEASERGGRLTFTMRSDAEARAVLEGEVVREGDETVSYTRGSDQEAPGRVRVKHVDAEGRFEARVAEFAAGTGASVTVEETDVPLALTHAEGVALAEQYVFDGAVGREELTCSLPPSRRDVSVGDLLALGRGDATWRVDRIVDAGARRVEARRVETATFGAGDEVEVGSARQRPATPLPADAVFLDLPVLTDGDVPHAPRVAVAAQPWPGEVAVFSAVGDENYRLNSLVARPSFVGTALTELASAAAGRWDMGPDLVVRLPRAALETVCAARLFAGANALAIGAPGGWEVLQFREAELVAPETWALRRRLRGLRGTDALLPRELEAGARVVMLDGGVGQIDLRQDAIGLERDYRIGPAEQPFEHPGFSHHVFAGQGEGLRPFAPVHLRTSLDHDGLSIRWVRRSRALVEGWGVADMPLGEASERYRVELWAGGLLRSAVETSSEVVFVGVAELAEVGFDGVDRSVRVAQVSDIIGPGHWATASV